MRLPCVVAQGIADLSNRGVNAVIRVEVKILAPQPINNFLATDQSSLFPDEQDEQIHGDAFQTHRLTGASEFIPSDIQYKPAELQLL